MYVLVFTDTAKKQIDKLDARLRQQVDNGLLRLAKNPRSGKPLRGELKGVWSERVATFRILYRIQEQKLEVVVLVVEHRKSVYGGH